MGDRYTRLFSLPETLYTEGAPVLIVAGALLKDNVTRDVLAQIKLRNIVSKKIKAVKVEITPLDTVGKALGDTFSYQYLDFSAERDIEFGQKIPIVLPDRHARGFAVAVTNVAFSDNSEWKTTDRAWESLPSPAPLSSVITDKELEKQYQIRFGQDYTYAVSEVKDVWFCSCGALNKTGEGSCHRCKRSLMAQTNVNLEALCSERDERLAKEQKEREAEKQRREEAARAAQERARKNKKTAAILLAAMAVCVVLIVVTAKVIIPSARYNSAITLMEEGRFDEAAEAFSAMDGYKDSAAMAAEAKNAAAYEAAIQLYENGEYQEAAAAFDLLGDYRDAADKKTEVEYAYANELLDNGEYDEAAEVFGSLGDYLDSTDKLKETAYRATEKLMENGNYEEAVYAFQELGDYKDSPERILEATDAFYAKTYNDAIELYESGYPAAAYLIFSTIVDTLGEYEEADVYAEETLNEAIYNAMLILQKENIIWALRCAKMLPEGYEDVEEYKELYLQYLPYYGTYDVILKTGYNATYESIILKIFVDNNTVYAMNTNVDGNSMFNFEPCEIFSSTHDGYEFEIRRLPYDYDTLYLSQYYADFSTGFQSIDDISYSMVAGEHYFTRNESSIIDYDDLEPISIEEIIEINSY